MYSSQVMLQYRERNRVDAIPQFTIPIIQKETTLNLKSLIRSVQYPLLRKHKLPWTESHDKKELTPFIQLFTQNSTSRHLSEHCKPTCHDPTKGFLPAHRLLGEHGLRTAHCLDSGNAISPLLPFPATLCPGAGEETAAHITLRPPGQRRRPTAPNARYGTAPTRHHTASL